MKNPSSGYPWVLCEVAGGVYGLSSKNVVSIGILESVTHMPNSSPYVRGVINLRGKILKVTDLRVKLGFESIQKDVHDMEAMLAQRKQDHINWVNALEKSVAENTPFMLTTDPHACAFGKWYDTFKTEDRLLIDVLKRFDPPHKKIHSAAVDIKRCQESGDFLGAKNIIGNLKDNELKEMIELFGMAINSYKESKNEIVIVLEYGNGWEGIIVDKVISVELLIEESEHSQNSDIANEVGFQISKRKNDNSLVLLLEEEFLFREQREVALV